MSKEIDKEKEAVIIRSVLAGNKEEFRHLLRNYQDMIYSMILRQVGNSALAEDLAQETFIKAYKNLYQFKNEARFSTWLVRIALNTTNSHLISKKHKLYLKSQQFELVEHETSVIENSNEPLEKELALKRLQLCIQKLKPVFRDVVVICSLEQKSYEEASRILQIPVGTIRSRLSRARKQLQELYSEI